MKKHTYKSFPNVFIGNLSLRKSGLDPRLQISGMKRGFTLIELLVVVLIIGVLSAIALPQYQLTITKTRTMAQVPALRAIANAQHIYYMANGKYSLNLNDLDIEFPGGYTRRTDTHVYYPQYYCYVRAGDIADDTSYSASCSSPSTPRLEIYYALAELSNKLICWPRNGNTYEQVCKSITGLSERNVPEGAYAY